MSTSPAFRRLLVVIKQTAFEEYSQLRARGQAPKALRWKRLESRYQTHQQCVNDLLDILKRNNLEFSCVNRVELDRQHLADVDLVIAIGGDGTFTPSFGVYIARVFYCYYHHSFVSILTQILLRSLGTVLSAAHFLDHVSHLITSCCLIDFSHSSSQLTHNTRFAPGDYSTVGG